MNLELLTARRDIMGELLVRPLTAADAQAYRELRKHILAIGDGRYFSDSYTREAALTEEGWRQWCSETKDHCIIGTFLPDNQLIGIMMITMLGHTGSPIVEWEATWLDPRYRKGGIAKQAYEKVYQWTKQQGYEFAVVFIRSDNERSKEIRLKQGFTYMHTKKNEVWADGSVADTDSYMLDLCALERQQRRALTELRDTLEFLHDDKPLENAAREKMASLVESSIVLQAS